MIEIDLLPLELREKEKIDFKQIFKKKLLVSILIYLVIFHVFLHIVTMLNSRRLTVLENRWQGMSSKKAQIDQLKQKLAKVNTEISLIEQVISNRVLWSQKLNRISDLVVSGIWLNELSVAREKIQQEKSKGAQDEPAEYLISLVIRGSAASRTKDEPALIGRFMQNLKDDPYFSEGFSDIELGPIKERQIQQTEVMDFILNCRFKQKRAQALLE